MPLPAAHLQSVQATVKMANASDLSLRGGQRPTWRPEREARGSALGVQSRGICPDHKKPRRKRKTFYRDIFRQNVFDISGTGGYNKDVETPTVATNIEQLSVCEFFIHKPVSRLIAADGSLFSFSKPVNDLADQPDD